MTALADWTDDQVHDLIHGDESCSDENCYYCWSPLRPNNLRLLAKNLAIAGWLCRSWELGRVYGSDPRMDGPTEWAPGCGWGAS